MDMYEQLVMFKDDSSVQDFFNEVVLKPVSKAKPLSARQIIKKTLHLTRTKKNLLGDMGSKVTA